MTTPAQVLDEQGALIAHAAYAMTGTCPHNTRRKP